MRFDFLHRALIREVEDIDVEIREDKNTIIVKRFAWKIVFTEQDGEWYRIAYDEYDNDGKSCRIDSAYFCDDIEERLKTDIELLKPSKYYDNGLE